MDDHREVLGSLIPAGSRHRVYRARLMPENSVALPIALAVVWYGGFELLRDLYARYIIVLTFLYLFVW